MAANIAGIIQKVRRLTRSPSTAQISDADIVDYVNTFYLYDFPEQLRTFNYHDTFTWTCNPFQDEYRIDFTTAQYPQYQLRDFKNLYLTINPPIMIAGFMRYFSQSRQEFFSIYPQVRSIANIGANGDGVTTLFTGFINANQAIIQPGQITNNSILQGKVLFDSISTTNQSLAMVDVPLINAVTGELLSQGNLYVSGLQPTTNPTVLLANNNVNYVTGQFRVTFPSAPAAGAPINSQSVPSPLGIPQAMLFYDNMLTLRPVPDQPYQITMEVYKRPIALDTMTNTIPELEEYWQLLSYGAARKIFQDRMDLDSVALTEPEFREQMRLVLRRTLVQRTNQRTATIYTESQSGMYQGWGFGSGGGQF